MATMARGVESELCAPGAEWLYPLVEGPNGTSFGKGSERFSGYAEFQRMVMSTRISRGEGPLHAGLRSMRVGDVLWLTAQGEVGVVGRGIVQSVARHPEPRVTFGLDRAVCRVLAQDPVPVSMVRRELSGRIDRPIPLGTNSELSEWVQGWVETVDEEDRRRLEPFDVTPLREALRTDPSRLDSPMFGALTRMFRGREMAIGTPVGPSGVSVVACDDRTLVIAQIVGRSKNAGRQVLESVGLLGWHGRSLADAAPSCALTPQVWFAFEVPPPADLVEFLEEAGAFVCWSEGETGVHLGTGTQPRWGASAPRSAVKPDQIVGPAGAGLLMRTTAEPASGLEPHESGSRGTWVGAVRDADDTRVDHDPRRAGAPESPRGDTDVESPPVSASLAGCTGRSRSALLTARELAVARGHLTLETTHLVLALLDDPGERLASILWLLDVHPDSIQSELERHLDALPVGEGRITLGSDIVESFQNARSEARQNHRRRIDADHLFLGVLRTQCDGEVLLRGCGIHLVAARAALAAWKSRHPTVAALDPDRDRTRRRAG